MRIDSTDRDALVETYNFVLAELLEKHAPLKNKTIIVRENVPWFNDEIKSQKLKRRKLENVWRQLKQRKNENDHDEIEKSKIRYKNARTKVVNMIDREKVLCYNKKIENCNKDQKQLFQVLNELLCTKSDTKLPECDSDEILANDFNKFFVKKIEKIREDLSKHQNGYIIQEMSPPSILHGYEPVSETEVRRIISKASNASCSLDPIPTRLLKAVLDELLPVLTKITNSSIMSGVFPNCLKSAIVRPHLKKPSLSNNEFKNFRPVSNIPFVSKIIEKSVTSQVNRHMEENQIFEPLQSAYRAHHSTETALIRIQNDILGDLDDRRGVVLVLLDLSAAFDTIDHSVLKSRLKHRIGVTDIALKWFESYHHERTQRVLVNNTTSESISLPFGAPQGSTIGAEEYKLYTIPLGDIIRRHGLQFHLYADDGQLHVSFVLNRSEDLQNALEKIANCTRDIKKWMTENYLKLNDEKTEVIIITPRNTHSLNVTSVNIGDTTVPITKSAKNIGVTFDANLTLHEHITNTCRACFMQLRKIASIRRYISIEACESLVHALITSRLDYCNSMLYGLPNYQLKRLQCVQNMAARIVKQVGKYDHISPIMFELHWLPVHKRIEFKMLTMTFKIIHGLAPSYLEELIELNHPKRVLRSGTNHFTLKVPRYRTKTYGLRRFSVSAPTLWNRLPDKLRESTDFSVFKKLLKTHLFKEAYSLT